jgi:hypothetical protein
MRRVRIVQRYGRRSDPASRQRDRLNDLHRVGERPGNPRHGTAAFLITTGPGFLHDVDGSNRARGGPRRAEGASCIPSAMACVRQVGEDTLAAKRPVLLGGFRGSADPCRQLSGKATRIGTCSPGRPAGADGAAGNAAHQVRHRAAATSAASLSSARNSAITSSGSLPSSSKRERERLGTESR